MFAKMHYQILAYADDEDGIMALCMQQHYWIMQDGGHLASNACISAPRQDRYDILTASATTPMFWGPSNPLELVEILCDQTGSGKIKDVGN